MKSNKTKILIIVLVCLLIIFSLITIIFFYQNKEKNNEKENKTSLSEEKLEITEILKNYYLENNFLDKENLKEWNFTSVNEVSYSNDESLVYYEIIGNYSCKDNSSTCIYLEQVSDPQDNIYSYKIYIGLDSNKKIEFISGSLMNNDNILENQDPLKDENKYSQLVKDYFVENNFVQKDNLKNWNINEVIKEAEKDDYSDYILRGTYSCLDNSYSCLYLEQIGEPLEDSKYEFTFYVNIFESDTELKIVNLSQSKISSEQEENSLVLSKNNVISILKKYYQTNNFQDINNTKYWNIENIRFYGYRQENPNIKYYYVTSTFMCNDNSYNCIYVEQAGNSNKTNEYTANFYIGIEDSEVKSLSGVLMYDDFIIINSTLN